MQFQSTFPRGERRQLRKILHKTKQISIHVPSWGTTQCLANTRRMRLFQSTFPRGERRRRWICSTEEGNFNPRSLVGNDRRLRQDIRLLGISIHVPSWGTTTEIHAHPHKFRTTFPRGERLGTSGRGLTGILFRTTFPRGERHLRDNYSTTATIFRTTFPRGERQISRSHCSTRADSGPRSLVGNDGSRSNTNSEIGDSGPRSLVGNDQGTFIRRCWYRHSGPRSLVGNDWEHPDEA